ncbi:non-ribosomal peptide synthetase, partial [Chitinivorax sp. B]|uniref:non-ribosomal peptide synthetase n=1 Tax=Chitinivorax sp. B TaxID=2502235 RepID=UPI0010F58F55
AVVVAKEGTAGPRLIGYWLPAADTALTDAQALRQYLAGRLPDYMVPAALVSLTAWPLLPNGKLDRRALPEPEGGLEQRYEAPATPLEEKVAQLWAELLQLDRVGRHDNFFELGGHSLLALQMVARLRKQGLEGEVRTLFAQPTPAGFAGSLRQAVSAVSHVARIPPGTARITPEMLPLIRLNQQEIDRLVEQVPQQAANVQDIYPLVPLQEGILFQHLLSDAGDDYLLPVLMAFDTRSRLDAFVDALQAVINRHDILRTAVHWDDLPEPVQVVWRDAPLSIETLHFDAMAGEVAEQLRARFDTRHFKLDVRKAPLMHAAMTFDAAHNRWLLLLLHHHLAIDHTTLSVILEEIQAHLQGWVDQLPPPVPFSNFVAQARLGVDRSEHETFFKRMLGEVDEPTLPFGWAEAYGGGQVVEAKTTLSDQLAQQLRVQARQLGVSVASLCHLAWAQVLGLISGRHDVVFGTVLFGRMNGGEGADRAVGLFVNTLPIRVTMDAVSVADAVKRTHQLLTELLRHEHASLALAQRCSAVQAPMPLFTALFNYRYSGDGEAGMVQRAQDASAWDGIDILFDEERSNYPLNLDIDDLGNGFILTAQVAIPDIQPARICGLMQTAVSRLVAVLEIAPDTPFNAIDVLPDEERQQILQAAQGTILPLPQHRCLHQLFEVQAARRPHAPALHHQDQEWSYVTLNTVANQLADYLRELGVGPDVRVGLSVERGFNMVLGMLAVLKAGGCYVPLDPTYPAERRAAMLTDSRPLVLLTDTPSKSTVQAANPQVPLIDLDADASLWNDRSADNVSTDAMGLTSRHLAYVIYTSGSTGVPKGVAVEHQAVCNQITALQAHYQLHECDRLLQFAAYSFDVAVEEIFGALSTGATLVLRTPAWLTGAADFWALCAQHHISIANLPTLFWQQLASAPEPIPTTLRQIIIGGDAVSEQALDDWFARPGYRPKLSNAYGPTETTINATVHEPTPDDVSRRSIGRPLPNVRVYLLDSQLKPVPFGAVGEIYIGGPCLARGYLTNPVLTAERFLHDPFADERTEARMYKTGDLGQWLGDGTVAFLGRNDHQVKLRGFRIELAEIETQLARCEGVREAVVLLREEVTGDKRLVAYFTGEEAPAADRLRQQLATRLPDYMLPAAYVHLPALPLLPNGKLDRRSLPAPDETALAKQSFEPPVGEMELALAKLWADLLGTAQIGRHDNFFGLGGHSLLVTQLVVRIRQGMEVELPLQAVFTSPTLAELAERVIEAQLSQFDLDDLAEVARLLQHADSDLVS